MLGLPTALVSQELRHQSGNLQLCLPVSLARREALAQSAYPRVEIFKATTQLLGQGCISLCSGKSHLRASAVVAARVRPEAMVGASSLEFGLHCVEVLELLGVNPLLTPQACHILVQGSEALLDKEEQLPTHLCKARVQGGKVLLGVALVLRLYLAKLLDPNLSLAELRLQADHTATATVSVAATADTAE